MHKKGMKSKSFSFWCGAQRFAQHSRLVYIHAYGILATVVCSVLCLCCCRGCFSSSNHIAFVLGLSSLHNTRHRILRCIVFYQAQVSYSHQMIALCIFSSNLIDLMIWHRFPVFIVINIFIIAHKWYHFHVCKCANITAKAAQSFVCINGIFQL